MVAMSSFSVTSGLRAISVAAWCRRSCGCTSASPTAAHAPVHSVDRSERRSGSPDGLVNIGAVISGPT